MGTTLNASGVRRDGLWLARGFAVVLFALAGILGAVAALGAAMVITRGQRSDALILVSTGTIAWVLGWLGARLWAGRSIPGWFLAGVFGLVVVVPFLGLLATGEWGLAMMLLGTILPGLVVFDFGLIFGPRTAPGKAKDAADDLA
ncbi:hypothetical protein [Paludisphaera soli]|uniref:hypothetical protein n=1 Tax=Paludisphaera soli TaxID=2712865 RepID=UPI0013EAE55C|nr:hypothetical protein [Paludisphaera soli]